MSLESPEESMFEKEALDSLVQQQLVNVPEDHHIALVTVVNQDGIKLVTAIKLDDDWQIQAYVQAKPHEKFAYGASIQWSR